MPALALEARSVVLAPVAAALMISVTTMVTRSSTRFARISRARLSRRDEADQMAPGAAESSAAAADALLRYWSSGESAGGFFSFLGSGVAPNAPAENSAAIASDPVSR